MDLSEISGVVKNKLDAINVELLFSETMFLKHKHVYICDIWVSDDPAGALKKFGENYYKMAINSFLDDLINEKKIAKVDDHYYWVSEIRKLFNE